MGKNISLQFGVSSDVTDAGIAAALLSGKFLFEFVRALFITDDVLNGVERHQVFGNDIGDFLFAIFTGAWSAYGSFDANFFLGRSLSTT